MSLELQVDHAIFWAKSDLSFNDFPQDFWVETSSETIIARRQE